MQRFCHFREKCSSIRRLGVADRWQHGDGRSKRCTVRLLFTSAGAMCTRVLIALLATGCALPTLAQTSPADEGGAGTASKKCDTLKRRIAKEQSSLASFEQTIAADKKGRETCSTKPMCARYDEAIKTIEARKAQHEARLAKFKSDADAECKSP